MSRLLLILLCVCPPAILCGGATLFAEEAPDFNREIRPILSDRCYFCHGPDTENNQAGLRLDSPDGSRDVIETGELLRRINSDDPYEQMPPPESKLSLTAEEKDLIRRWIESGAEYEGHWAFEDLPAAVQVPDESDDDWSKQTIDRFVRKSLSDRGVAPSPEAEPMRWLRRVTLDLTGLPPTIEEIEQFDAALQRGEDPDVVYEQTVDRLLASDKYGEHMAVGWLDAVRYADSYGYQSDRLNTQWPYRDWVVRAFNQNLPYDQFLTWQVAGDLLESPTRDQLLATAFNRIHRLNNEGGAVFEEWRIENVSDRVHTFGTAVLGLTLECCRCHDHKYDPISARDYYSLSAFFNSIDENGVYDNTEKVPAPSLLLPTAEQAAVLDSARRTLERAEADYAKAIANAQQRFAEWLPAADKPLETPDLIRSLSFDVAYIDALKEVYYPAAGDATLSRPLPTVEVSDSRLPPLEMASSSDGAASADDQSTSKRLAVKLDGEHGVVLPGIEPFDRWTPFSVVVGFNDTKRVAAPSVVVQASRGQLAFNGWDLLLDDGFLELRMYRVWPGNAIGVRSLQQIPKDEWVQVTATYDGSSRAAGLKLYLNGKELETKVVRDRIKKRAMVEVMHGGKLTIGQRFRGRGLDGGLVDDFRVFGRELSPAEITHFFTGDPIVPTPEYYASAIDTSAQAALAKLNAARREFVMAEEVMQEIPIMDEMSQPRETHVLARGAYDAATSDETRVTRETFERIGPELPADQPVDRLGLARWATLPNHPLTSRVIVNRLWSRFLGHGLVRTPENFGLQGELPTHPELLDWLARDFIDSGWDIKRFCRNVVLSATYRQDSRTTAALASKDPQNKWLARGPAHRLAAEQIRDLALMTSGLLHGELGGPPVSPYQAGGDLWRESNTMSPAYQQSVGQDLYRRSLYSVWKRTAPLPNMMAFDTESREVCTVKRARTNTPLQALVLMNDVQFVEAARALAQEAIEREEDDNARIEWAFRKLTGRYPDSTESDVLNTLLVGERAHYADNQMAARELIELGESQPTDAVDPAELASLTIVCQTILNLDATVWKR